MYKDKHLQDVQDIADGRPIDNFGDFFMSFWMFQFGLKDLAKKNRQGFIDGLLRLKEKDVRLLTCANFLGIGDIRFSNHAVYMALSVLHEVTAFKLNSSGQSHMVSVDYILDVFAVHGGFLGDEGLAALEDDVF